MNQKFKSGRIYEIMKFMKLTWQVTAVQGKVPMNEPNMQSHVGTPQTPQAILIPDHGTTPTSLSTESLTQAPEVLDNESTSASVDDGGLLAWPSNAERVISRTRGRKRMTSGASGAASDDAQSEPIVVRNVNRIVANTGENSAPASTFHMTLPGIDHACFHTAVTARTPTTCIDGQNPLSEYR